VVTKPVVGVLDFASNVTEGIRNTTTVFDQATIDKVRLPRFIAADGILRVRFRVSDGRESERGVASADVWPNVQWWESLERWI
jgi:hypothetical protein